MNLPKLRAGLFTYLCVFLRRTNSLTSLIVFDVKGLVEFVLTVGITYTDLVKNNNYNLCKCLVLS